MGYELFLFRRNKTKKMDLRVRSASVAMFESRDQD